MSINYSEEQFDELLTTSSMLNEDLNESSLRPRTLDEYIGQKKAKDNLSVFISAAKMRNEPLDHVLLHGPPGLGKTTLAAIIANEMNVNIRITSGPAIEKPGDLVAMLTNLNDSEGHQAGSAGFAKRINHIMMWYIRRITAQKSLLL